MTRRDHEPPRATDRWGWRYHHTGIPTRQRRDGEEHLPQLKMHVSGFPDSPYGVEWMRFDADCPIPDLVRTVPHVAFEVDDLDEALEGKEVLSAPSSPSAGVRVAMIVDNGGPIELIQFTSRGAAPASPGAVLAAIGVERHAVEAGDVDQYLSVLTEDAVFMPPNSGPKHGAELREWLRAFVKGFRAEWLSFVSTEVRQAGETAYHCFTYTWRVHPRSGGEPTLASGKGVHLLRRQQDGSWRIAREIWNASPAGPQQSPEREAAPRRLR